MKKIISLTLLCSGAFFGTQAFAQQCTVFDGSVTTSPNTVTGNTCGKNLGLATFCTNGNQTNGAGSSIVQLTVGAVNNFTVAATSTTTGFNPELALIASTCASATGCIIDQTNNTQTIPPQQVPANSPAGTYYAIISDLNTEAPGCGAYTFAVAGTLPVQLQNFSVE